MQLMKGEALKNPINKLFKSEREHKETSNHNVLFEVAQISDVQFTERSSVLKQKWQTKTSFAIHNIQYSSVIIAKPQTCSN